MTPSERIMIRAEVKTLNVHELRASVVLQRVEIDRMAREIAQLKDANRALELMYRNAVDGFGSFPTAPPTHDQQVRDAMGKPGGQG